MISSIGKSGARSSGPTGCPVPGCSTGRARVRHVGGDVVPAPRDLRLVEQVLRLLHGAEDREPNPVPRSRRTLRRVSEEQGAGMIRIVSVVAACVAVAAALAGGIPAAAGPKPYPDVIQLPTGFRPEGIEIGRGTRSTSARSRQRRDLPRQPAHRRRAAMLDPGRSPGRPATGIELDRHNGSSSPARAAGNAYVYDARTGALVKDVRLRRRRRRSSTTSS